MGEQRPRWTWRTYRTHLGRRCFAAGVTVAMLVAPMAAATASSTPVTTRVSATSHNAGAVSRLTYTFGFRSRLRHATIAVTVPKGWAVPSARDLGVNPGRCHHAGVPRRTERGVRMDRLSCPAGAALALTVRTHLPTTAAAYTFTTSLSYGPRGHRSHTVSSVPFRVHPAAADHLVLTPAAATTTYGRTRSFRAYAVDAFGNRRGNVTDEATFSMSPDGSCAAATCGQGAHADTIDSVHQVTGTLGRLSGTAELLVNPQHVTVTAQPATKVYGGADPTFAYHVDGLVAGDDSLAGVNCTVAGAHVGVGTYPLTCQGSTDPDYVVDRYDASTLTISPAPLVVPIAGRQTYGGTPSYDADLSTSGLVNGDTPAVVGGALACHTSAQATSNVGSYTISGCTGLSAANYTISYAYGALTVTPAPVAVTADDKTMVAGEADPAYTYTTSPSGITLAGVTCAAAGSHTTAGSYPITCTLTTDPNYTETANNPGTLTVQPPAAVCGNSVLDPGEVCDDGNTVNEASCPYGAATCNACNSTCTAVLSLTGSYCGDGTVDAAQGEACDDGNNVNETSCPYGDATCYACDSTCSAPLPLTGSYCGDGVVDPADGEACDDGNNVNETSCPAGQATCSACSADCATIFSLTG